MPPPPAARVDMHASTATWHLTAGRLPRVCLCVVGARGHAPVVREAAGAARARLEAKEASQRWEKEVVGMLGRRRGRGIQREAEEKEMLNGAIRVTTQGTVPIESFVKMPKETVTAISPTQKFRLQNSLRGFKRVPIAGSPQWMRIGQRHEGWMEV